MTTSTASAPRTHNRVFLAFVSIAIGISLWAALRSTEPQQQPQQATDAAALVVPGRRYIEVDGALRLICGDGKPAIAAHGDDGVTTQFCDVAPTGGD